MKQLRLIATSVRKIGTSRDLYLMTIGLDFDPSEMNQSILNAACRPRRKVKHWTPKGGCKVTGNEERNQLQEYEENPFKMNRHK